MHRQPPRRRPWPLLTLIVALNLTLTGAALLGLARQPQAAAKSPPPLTPAEQSILDEVRRLTGAAADLAVDQEADGTRFIDTQGQLQAVLLAKIDANGNPIARCVTTLEEAAAFLQGTDPAAAMVVTADRVDTIRNTVESAQTIESLLANTSTVIEIVNLDGPGEGFNEATPASPIGGNTGTTVGQQRLRAFEYAAAIWASTLQSTVTIRIGAQFNQLTCNATSAVLGQAGPSNYAANFTGSGLAPGPEYLNTFYPIALANKRAGRDLDPSGTDLTATFNSEIGNANCLAGRGWYYGLDGNESSQIDLVSTLLHEFGHGLGFLSLGSNDLWNQFLFDNTQNKLWKDLTSDQRSISATNNGNLVWAGPLVSGAAPSLLQPTPVLTITTPPAIAGQYPVGLAEFGAPLSSSPLAGELVPALDPADSFGGATTDACSAITNPALVSGKIALVDRGTCAFTTKARNVQEAGAIAMLLINDRNSVAPPFLTGSDPGVTIPVASLAQADGTTIRAQLGATVAGRLGRDLSRLAGVDAQGRVRMYAPTAFSSGSSVSHFDVVASPNLLMEPAINADLDQSLDLTDELLRDIGWHPDQNYNDRDDRIETIQVSQALNPPRVVQPGDTITLTITVRNLGATTDQVQLESLFNPALTGVGWTASYSGGGGGPAAGSGDLSAALELPAGAQATFQISATIGAGTTAAFTNTATITLGEPALDLVPEDNTATITISVATMRLYLPTIVQ